MKLAIAGMVTAGLMFSGAAVAADMPAVGKAKCAACHAIEKKVIGPAWMDVSKKYKGDPEAVNKIVMNVVNGGAFGWKTGTTMPPRGLGANDAEVQKLAAFIAELANAQ